MLCTVWLALHYWARFGIVKVDFYSFLQIYKSTVQGFFSVLAVAICTECAQSCARCRQFSVKLCSISVHASMQSGECSVCVVLEASEVVWLTCLARILHFTQRRMQRLVCALCSVCGLGGGGCIRGGLVGVFGGHCASKCLQSDAHCSVCTFWGTLLQCVWL